jgi:hypothetical protein
MKALSDPNIVQAPTTALISSLPGPAPLDVILEAPQHIEQPIEPGTPTDR